MLVPLDGSELAEIVFHYARELAREMGLEVFLLHVANPQQPELLPMFLSYVEHAAEIVSGVNP
jgi:nucleotide-binding universal stress UspA family protein